MTITELRPDLALHVDAKTLAAAVSRVARYLPVRPTHPALGGVLLECGPDGLTLSGFDGDTAACTSIAAETFGPGKVLVSGRLLAAITGALRGDAELRREGSKVLLAAGGVRATLPVMDLGDLSPAPARPSAIGTVTGETLGRIASRVAVAVSTDPNAYNLPCLMGVHLTFGPGGIRAVGADGYRLAVDSVDWEAGTDREVVAVMPGALLTEAAKTFAGADAVTVLCNGGLVGFESGRHSVVVRQLESEKYPLPMLAAMARRSSAPVVVDVAELVAALKTATLVQAPRTPSILDIGADRMVVSAADGTGEAGISLPVACHNPGPDVTVRVNPQYALDALSALGSATAELSITDPKRPLLFTSPDDDTYRHTCMPIRNL